MSGGGVRLRRVWIQNFRGIKTLDWTLPLGHRLQVLIGPGDSGKSTILDGVHYLLSDRWNVPFSDDDFFDVDVGTPITIRALVIDLPPALMKESSFGLWLTGVDEEGGVYQDPTNDLLPGLLTQLTVDATLEPQWSVTRVDGAQQPLNAHQRRAFSTFKVDDRTDAQLRWSRNSALGRMSAKEGGDRLALAAASRAARETLAGQEGSALADLVKSVQDAANHLGSGRFRDVKAGLDTSRSAMGAGLALYEGVVPLTSYGLGSRRLMSLAVQQLAVEGRSLALVDELEHGLEPHRAVQLLNHLAGDNAYAQVLVTTHSPVIVEQAQLENLATVQNRDGVVTVTSLGQRGEVLERLRRARPSSLLARRVVIAEGKTEHGLLLQCVESWDEAQASVGLPTAAGEGAAIQDAQGGSEVALRAQAMTALGFTVAGLCDNDDRSVDAELANADAAGVVVVRWDQGNHLEAQVCSELDAAGLQVFLQLGVDRRHDASTVLADLKARGLPGRHTALDVGSWLGEHQLEEVRSWIVAAAVKAKWFKDVEGGRELGRWILQHYSNPQLAATVACLESIRSFIYVTPPGEDDGGEGSATSTPRDESRHDG